ncbi:MAG TPA: hypothetical protein VFL15_03850 [Gammaproteobacteria bacterium]|nr:hypothetical protein [Gammaproteobacteria bacterium]
MHKYLSAIGLLTLLALGGCGSLPCGDPHPYYTNTAGPPLKVPPGLSAPIPDPAYAIPGGKPSTGKRTDVGADSACLIRPPTVITPESTIGPKPASGTQSAPAPTVKSPQARPASSGGTTSPVPAATTRARAAVASGGPIG